MCASYSLLEYGTIWRSRDFSDQPDTDLCLYLPDLVFDRLRSFVTDGTAEPALTYGIERGREQIRLRNYVGLLDTRTGVRLEILPKIGLAVPGAGLAPARAVLVTMLRRLRHSPFRNLGPARLQATDLPLWDVFLDACLAEAQTLLGQGLQPAFVTLDADRPFLRGKWRLADQLRQPWPRPDRLALRLTQCLTNTAPNRLLKTTLLLVARHTQRTTTRQRAHYLLTALAEVPPTNQPEADLATARRAGRLYARYGPVLDWAALLLTGRVPGASAGVWTGPALLFPMERVFEDYVSAGFRQYGTGVSVQEASAHLVENHSGGPRFGLRPDLIVRQNGHTRVFDTKWKTVRGNDPGGNYGLEQADLYQLYAYSQKYDAPDVYLIFPANETFREPLPVFGYDAHTRLHVLPFDLTRPLADEVEKCIGPFFPS